MTDNTSQGAQQESDVVNCEKPDDTLTTAATDRAALAALYHTTGDPNWTNNGNWLSDRPFGEWHSAVVIMIES